MKRKFLTAFLAALLAVCALGLIACGGDDSGSTQSANDGTYYLYENGIYQRNYWVKINGESWEDDDGVSGRVSISNGVIILYAQVFGQEEEMFDGSIASGVLTLNVLGEKKTYLKEGATIMWTVTYDANGGKLAGDVTTREVKNVNNNSLLYKPYEYKPTREGLNFVCWAKDADGKQPWKFKTDKVNSNLTLYAVWSEFDVYQNDYEEIILSEYSDKTVKYLEIPSYISNIGSNAFTSNYNLVSVTFEEGSQLKYIGSSAFSLCYNLKSVTLPSGLNKIDVGAFSYCRKLQNIEIPSSVTVIEDRAFFDCGSLVEINFDADSQLEKIGANAFESCDSLISVEIPAKVTTIEKDNQGKAPFSRCFKLVEIVNYSDITIDAQEYEVEHVITSLAQSKIFYQDEYVFYNDNGSYYLMGYLGNSTRLRLPDKANGNNYKIYKSAFSDNYRLNSVTLSTGVTGIGDNAFAGCENLIEIINKPGFDFSTGSFGGIADNALSILTDTPWVSNFSEVDGLIFYKHNSKYYLMGYNGYNDQVSLPENINGSNYEIYKNAFKNNDTISSITISKGVEKIGKSAFSESLVKTVTFASDIQLKVIDEETFYYCYYLESINIPSSVTDIKDRAFCGCSVLKSLSILDNSQLSKIGENAFNGCKELDSIFLPTSVTTIGEKAFYNCEKINVYCQAQSKPDGWSTLWNPNSRPVTWGYIGE